MQVKFNDLTVGVEIEFSGITRLKATQVLVEYFGTTYVRYGGWENEEFTVPDQQSRIWQIVKDNSVDAVRKGEGNTVIPITEDYKCEMVTPILQYADIPILLGVVASLKAAGAITGANCGIHVHIGSELFNAKSLRTLCNLVYRHQYLLSTALSVRESRKLQYCADLSEEFIEKLNKVKPQTFEEWNEVWYSGFNALEATRSLRRNETRYRILNLHNLLSGRFKAVEFRLFNGSLDIIRIKSYIQLCLLITDKAFQSKKAITRIAMSDNNRFTFRVSLLKLNAIGSEFRDMRLLLLKQLSGDSGRRRPNPKPEPVLSNII
ncbi:amidoligase family protein [Paenibacillus sp. 32352]|uniref:amidoligase family protein n=1 Tax=Paenibacillus sp. 32352 TaxID=1969111 RepID=UPI0009AEFB8B|nr:amidoligase family protein [Paenibacillus sp. 32352]